jgi:hypothetical protein
VEYLLGRIPQISANNGKGKMKEKVLPLKKRGYLFRLDPAWPKNSSSVPVSEKSSFSIQLNSWKGQVSGKATEGLFKA